MAIIGPIRPLSHNILFLKPKSVSYRLVQPFPPEYFRQKISFYFKLPTAGRYLLRQGLFYLVLIFMGLGSPARFYIERSLN
jgi:hypothetical protein